MTTIDLLYRRLPENSPHLAIPKDFSVQELDEAVATFSPLCVIASLIQLKVEDLKGFLTKKLSPNSILLVQHSIQVKEWDEKLKELRMLIDDVKDKNRRNHEALESNNRRILDSSHKVQEHKTNLEDVQRGRHVIDEAIKVIAS